jgi:hypothetical protein
VLLATFTQGSATLAAGSYTALVDWGDGGLDISTEASSPITISVSGQTISVDGSHTYAQAGTYKAKVTLFSNDAEVTTTVTVTVT